MKKVFEMQGPESVPDDAKDVIFVRNDKGELVELEVVGDNQC